MSPFSRNKERENIGTRNPLEKPRGYTKYLSVESKTAIFQDVLHKDETLHEHRTGGVTIVILCHIRQRKKTK